MAAFIFKQGELWKPQSGFAEADYNSVIYVQNEDGQFEEYLSLHSSENRVWVDYNKIPEYMKDAIVAMRTSVFWITNGVDWKTTFEQWENCSPAVPAAVLPLLSS